MLSKNGVEPVSPAEMLAAAKGAPADEPRAFESPAPTGSRFPLAAATERLAQAASSAAAADGAREVGRARALERPAAAAIAGVELSHVLGVLAETSSKLSVVVSLLGGRLHRTRLAGIKAVFLTLGLVLGEVSLNSAAAIYSGDIPWQAILSFAGVGVATVAVGWAAGAQIRRCVDRLTAGKPSEAATAAHLSGLFASAGTRWLLAAAASTLLVGAVLLGAAVGVLRSDAGGNFFYGLFTILVVLGAGAVAYAAEDQVLDLAERLGTLRTELAGRAMGLGTVMDEHYAKTALTAGTAAAATAEVLSQAALVHGTGELKMHENPANFGHFRPAAAGADPAVSLPLDKARQQVDPDFKNPLETLLPRPHFDPEEGVESAVQARLPFGQFEVDFAAVTGNGRH